MIKFVILLPKCTKQQCRIWYIMIRDKPIKIWIISKRGLEPLEIEASSFDEAIRKAREINKEYNTGQLKEIIP